MSMKRPIKLKLGYTRWLNSIEWLVVEFRERFRVDWSGFRQAVLDEYMFDDRTRVMMKTFLKCTKKGGKGLLVLLREFENKYNELSVRDRELLQ